MTDTTDWTTSRLKIGHVLRDRAAWVHDRLTEAVRLSVPTGEETITESLLLDMRLALGARLEVTPFSKYQESRQTGADWEWWFSDGMGQRMYGMRVQAKKLKERAGTLYYDFAYTPRLSKTRQIDRLLSAAQRDGLPAVYALYNGPELDLKAFRWRCCTEKQSARIFGVSMLSAESAVRLVGVGDTSLAAAGALSRPWSCLALCPNDLRVEQAAPMWPDGPVALSLYAADLVTDLMAQESEARGLSDRQQALRAARGYRTWDEAPQYARDLVERAGVVDQARPDQDFAIDLPGDLGGVAMFVGSATGDPRSTL